MTDPALNESGTLGVLPPDSVGYVASSGDPAVMCARCCYFLAGETSLCQKVSGSIAPGGWCQLYEGEEDMQDEHAAPGEPMPMAPAQEAAAIERPTATTVLIEAVDLSKARIDAEGRVIRNVVLIKAGMSKNRRFYGEDVLRKAVPVFEGVKAYADHNDPRERRGRSVRDLTGWYQNVRFERGALVADRHFTDNAAGEDIFRIARAIAEQRAPATLAGLSINAVGSGKPKSFDDGDAYNVEGISGAASVDDVDNPSAGGGYALVAGGSDPLVAEVLKALTFAEWQEARPDFLQQLKSQWKQVRLDEATKTALAEADLRVKAADAAAGQAQRALVEAQEDNRRLTGDRETALTQLQETTRMLALERALAAVQLPASYKNDLREELSRLPQSEWPGKVDKELSKAKRNGDYPPKVSVRGAGYQEAAPVEPTFNQAVLLPRPNENAAEWEARTAQYRTIRN